MQAALDAAVKSVTRRAGRQGDVIGVPTDVSRREDVERLKRARISKRSARSPSS